MNIFLIGICVFLIVVSDVKASGLCPNPEPSDIYSFTTEDGTVLTNVAFISEFTLKCNNRISDLPLYAEVNGKTFPAVHVGKTRYQVSWVDELQKAKSGDYIVSFYDEEGYANLRKAFRTEQPSSVKPLFTVTVNHPGTYQGPWLNSEFLAAAVAVLVWYIAYSTKKRFDDAPFMEPNIY